ncbi:MAG: type IV secretory system conjugative DNA transfer family protein, partial [Gelidibacter sp.]|nr:type IV secretory system conjugative DNA transfer family protein [Gelidibacter sp.]
MMAQEDGLDFKNCIETEKIVLIKLSQGLIGEENSYLLGSLFLSKINQAAQGRQVLEKQKRHSYYVYLDEFQNFITPSITSLLSGARKYGLGLILAHQELAQIDDPKVLNSVLSNPYTRICFRLGDIDAKRLESGFTYFESEDLQSLGTGQAIVRLGSSKNDCNITTSQLNQVDENASALRDTILLNTRTKYATPKAEVVLKLEQLLPKQSNVTDDEKENSEHKKEIPNAIHSISKTINEGLVLDEKIKPQSTSFEQQKNEFVKRENQKTQQRKHTNLQHFVKKVAQQRNYKVTLEHQTNNGGRVDVSLDKETVTIAIEISVTNTLVYEVKKKNQCIDSGYDHVFMISENVVHLRNIKNRATETIDKKSLAIVEFLNPLELAKRLDEIDSQQPTPKEE